MIFAETTAGLSAHQLELPSDFQKIIKESDGFIGLKNDGTVWGWGNNDHEQIGAAALENDTNSTESQPVEMQSSLRPLDQVVAIACNNGMVYALRSEGTVWSFFDHQLEYAVQLVGVTNVIFFSEQDGELLFVKEDGTFYKNPSSALATLKTDSKGDKINSTVSAVGVSIEPLVYEGRSIDELVHHDISLQDNLLSHDQKASNSNDKVSHTFTQGVNADPAVLPSRNIDDLGQEITIGNQKLTPDVICSIGSWQGTISLATGGAIQGNGIPFLNTGPQVAAAWKLQQDIGDIGIPSYYGASQESKQSGLWNFVCDPVSVVTGEFYINNLDIKLNGPMPLEIRRIYASQNQANNNFGHGWRLGYFLYLVLSSDSKATPSLIYAAETDGSVVAYRYQRAQNNWAPTAVDNPDLFNISDGSTITNHHLFNNRITQVTASDGTVIYQLRSSDGVMRSFSTKKFPIAGKTGITRERPYLDTLCDASGNTYTFHFGANSAQNDYGEIQSIVSSSGTTLHFNYDPYQHITEIFSNDGRYLKYNYDGYGDLTQVTLPDGSQIGYSYQHSSAPEVTAAESTNAVAVTRYSQHLMIQETRPDGRILKNKYDAQRRVITQSSTVGATPALVQNATFNYGVTATNIDNTINGTTTVIDVNGNKTSYNVASSQIHQITYPDQKSITQTWDPSSRNLTSRVDRRGLTTTFSYDSQGNLTSRSQTGNLTGSGSVTASTSMSYNGNNCLTGVIDPVGNSTTYAYGDNKHSYLPTIITKSANGSSMQLAYQNVGGACGLLVSEITRANNTTASETEYTYDTHGFLIVCTQKTGTQDADIVTKYSCNKRGEVIAQTDQSGARTTFDYDAMGRRIAQETYDPSSSLIDWHFWYYNDNGDIAWEQGARFNPTDKTYYDYDFAGRLHHKMMWLSAALPDGSGVASSGQATTTYDHDDDGNLTKIIDAKGHSSVMTYDAMGEMLTRTSGDGGVSEAFTYEPGGLVATHTTLLGGIEKNSYTDTGLLQSSLYADRTTSAYIYDLIGRIVQETFPNGTICKTSYNNTSGVVTKNYSDAHGSSLGTESETHDAHGNIVAWTDRDGNNFTSTFDALGRIKTSSGPAVSSQSQAQSAFHVYDAQRACETIYNALNESSTTFYDALGRPTLNTFFNSDGSVAKNKAYWYSADHQSVTTFDGTGANVIATTRVTDLQNRPVILHHADGSYQSTTYDAVGNKTSFSDEHKLTTSWTYDALNHPASETLPGGSSIAYICNAAGELLSRAMPAGLLEKNSYNSAGQKISDELDGADGLLTRKHLYTYGNDGLISSITDPRGFTTSIAYDGWEHPINIGSSGSSIAAQNQNTVYGYDARGLLTSVLQDYADSATGPETLVTRAYDGYGQLVSETTSLNGSNVTAWVQAWNGAGRRTGLKWTLDNQGPQYQFGYNAQGLMTSAGNGSGTCHYTYADNGLLSQRKTPLATTAIERNQRGEVVRQTISFGGASLLDESLAWSLNGRIDNYNVFNNALGMPNEARNYGYDGAGRLITEPFTSQLGTQTAGYLFDEQPLQSGTSNENGLGVRTSQRLNGSAVQQVAQESSIAQVTSDINNSMACQSSYDGLGEVTDRSFGNGSSQHLAWNNGGRLVTVDQRNSSGNGFHWSTTYDGLGRRIQTTYSDVAHNENSSLPIYLSYYNDPQVEFLELGHDEFGRQWNLYGPDRSGTYGGAQGIGGLESMITAANNSVAWSVNNYFGDRLASLTTAGPYPYGCVLGGYGPMPGSTVNADLVPQWRGHYLDWTGFYYMGARYYEPNSGRFLSADPLGHDASLSLYDYCGGDPVNGLDPDGRCAETGVAFALSPAETIKSFIFQDTLFNQTLMHKLNQDITSYLSPHATGAF